MIKIHVVSHEITMTFLQLCMQTSYLLRTSRQNIQHTLNEQYEYYYRFLQLSHNILAIWTSVLRFKVCDSLLCIVCCRGLCLCWTVHIKTLIWNTYSWLNFIVITCSRLNSINDTVKHIHLVLILRNGSIGLKILHHVNSTLGSLIFSFFP